MREISCLPIDDIRIIKLIRISKKVQNISVDGHIVYTRTFSNTYKMQDNNKIKTETERFGELFNGTPQSSYPNDEIDNLILTAVQTVYPEAEFFNKLLLFNVDEENNRYLKSRPKETCAIYILPNITMTGFHVQCQVFVKELNIYVDWIDANAFNNEGYSLYYQPNRESDLKLLLNKFDATVGTI